MKIKIILDEVSNMTWAIRLVEKGDGYGLNDQLVHNKDEPLVEFFDTRHPHTDLGQFVSRYNLSTLLDRSGDTGLDLYGGVPSWKVYDKAMKQLTQWLVFYAAWKHPAFAD